VEALYVAPDASSYDAGTAIVSTAKNMVNHLTTTITSFTNGEIKGTFSGDFYYNSNPAGAKKSITNGAFYVKVK